MLVGIGKRKRLRKQNSITPPWKRGVLAADYGEVRKDYADGVWSYAHGTPACEHSQYDEAVALARRGKWNPWWIRSLSDVDAVLDGCYMDEAAGARVCEFATRHLHYPPEEGGDNVNLIDWQVYDLTVPLFGWKRANEYRRFHRGTVWVPKKNGKSFLCSLFALYGLVGDNERAPEVYVAAGDRDQASIIYSESSHLAKSSSEVAKCLRFVDSTRRIYPKRGRGIYRVLSSDATLAEGVKWSHVYLDELHVQSPRMWQTLKGGGISRTQPLMLAISTAGIYDETSIAWNQWEMCEKIHSGALKNWSYFALMYRADSDGDWHDPAVWKRANPSYGVILRPEIFRELHDEAVANPVEQSNFMRYHLNVWTRANQVWIDQDDWRACAGQYDIEDMRGRRCYGGMDLSLEDDLTAFALWFPPQDDGEPHKLWTWFWLPKAAALAKAEQNAAPYDVWLRDGWVFGTEGNVIDYRVIKAFILDTVQQCEVAEIAYDRYNATQIVTELMDEGLTMVPHGQGTASMNAPVGELKKLVLQRNVEHPDNPVLNWQVSNCQIVYDSGGRVRLKKSDKAPGGGGKGYHRYKIDGVIAAVMGLSRAIVQPDAVAPGIVVL